METEAARPGQKHFPPGFKTFFTSRSFFFLLLSDRESGWLTGSGCCASCSGSYAAVGGGEVREQIDAAEEGLVAAAVWQGDEDGQRVSVWSQRICRSRASLTLIRPIRGKLQLAASFFFCCAFVVFFPQEL